MIQEKKLSLVSAILINLNIMIGTGIFINTVLLTREAGVLGAAVYALVGLLILPLIIGFSRLLAYYPGGTFYEFGKALNPLLGFISSWGYFTGKLATSALGIHIFTLLMQQINPSLLWINPLIIDTTLLSFFIYFNMFNLATGKNINYLFIVLKFIPISFVVIAAFLMYQSTHLTAESLMWHSIPCCIPFVLFAFSGFEASCSLSKSIEQPEKNGPRTLIISYCITLATVILYQLGLFSLLGSMLGTLSSFQQTLPTLIATLLPEHMTGQLFLRIITLSGIAASSLGASYGIIYSNIWNLYTLATNNHIIGSSYIQQKNRFNTPFICVIIAGLIVFFYLIFSQGYQVPLQQISATGALITYTISMLSLTKTSFFIKKTGRTHALLSILSCLILIISLAFNSYKYGIKALIVYAVIIIIGVTMFYATQPKICKLP